MSSHEALRGQTANCTSSSGLVSPADQGWSAPGPRAPPGLSVPFSSPSSWKNGGLPAFPMPRGISCLSFQLVCPLAQDVNPRQKPRWQALLLPVGSVLNPLGEGHLPNLHFGHVPIVWSLCQEQLRVGQSASAFLCHSLPKRTDTGSHIGTGVMATDWTL